MRASFAAGFDVTARWIARGVGRGWAIVALLVGVAWLAGRGRGASVGVWLDATDGLIGALAIALGAWGTHTLARERGAGPLAAAGVVPGAWLAGQATAITLALGLGSVGLALVGAVAHGGFRPVLLEPPVRVADEGAVAVDGERWALGGRGALRWRLDPAETAATFTTRLRVRFTRWPDGSLLVPLVVRVGDAETTTRVSPGGWFDVPVAASAVARDVVVRAVRDDVIVRPDANATRVVSDERRSGVAVWWRPAAVAWLRATWLSVVALALSLVAIPPIAVLGAIAMWLVGTVAPFLDDYARHIGSPSIFSARTGDAGGSGAVAWLSQAAGWMPDLRGGRVADALVDGCAPPVDAIAGDVRAVVVASVVGLAAAALAAMGLWRREAGRIPGRGGAR